MHRFVRTQSHARSSLLLARARSHLHAPTASEQRLWEGLRAAALPVAFKRQVVLGQRFIVDQLAPSVRLVVEVDGSSHVRRRSADARRDRALERAGYRVLRLPAELVMRDLPAAIERVRAELRGVGR
jgi:very-short-patch-repair endonuclease